MDASEYVFLCSLFRGPIFSRISCVASRALPSDEQCIHNQKNARLFFSFSRSPSFFSSIVVSCSVLFLFCGLVPTNWISRTLSHASYFLSRCLIFSRKVSSVQLKNYCTQTAIEARIWRVCLLDAFLIFSPLFCWPTTNRSTRRCLLCTARFVSDRSTTALDWWNWSTCPVENVWSSPPSFGGPLFVATTAIAACSPVGPHCHYAYKYTRHWWRWLKSNATGPALIRCCGQAWYAPPVFPLISCSR